MRRAKPWMNISRTVVIEINMHPMTCQAMGIKTWEKTTVKCNTKITRQAKGIKAMEVIMAAITMRTWWPISKNGSGYP
ncbi:MAG: hypothetical protein ACQERT_12365 [Thermodesulfobacteriota bacterium]